jgi:hypothetical protein
MATIQGYQNITSGNYFVGQMEYYQKQFIQQARENHPELSNLTDTQLLHNPTVKKEQEVNPLAPTWQGQIAERLGIDGNIVDSHSFKKACSGYTPTCDLNNDPIKMNSKAFDIENGKIKENIVNGKEEERRVAMEIMFTLSKEWGVIYAVADEETRKEIISDFQASVSTAFKEMEKDAIIRKMENGQVIEERASGILAVNNVHIENRGPEGGQPEPFIHGHGIILNTAQDKDGNYYSLTNDLMAKNKAHYNKVFSMDFNQRMRDRGYELEAKYKKADLNNEYKENEFKAVMTLVPKLPEKLKEAVKAFSQRHEQIVNKAQIEGGSDGVRAREIAQIENKNAKTTDTNSQLLGRWKSEMAQMGISETDIKSLKKEPKKAILLFHDDYKLHGYENEKGKTLTNYRDGNNEYIHLDKNYEKQLIDSFYDDSKKIANSETQIKSFLEMKLFEYTDKETAKYEAERIFTENFLQVVDKSKGDVDFNYDIASNPDNKSFQELEHLQIQRQRSCEYIDRQRFQDEKDMVEHYKTRSKDTSHVLSTDFVQEQIKKIEAELNKKGGLKEGQEGYISFKDEQIKAIYNATTKSGHLALWEGTAGAGKSFTAKALKDIYEAKGYKVIAIGTSNKNTENLAESIGAKESYNIDKFNSMVSKGKLTLDSKTIVIADEMGMANGNQWTKLSKHLYEGGSKLVAMGESTQLQAVGASAGFSTLSDLNLNTSYLRDVNRQEETWQRVATLKFTDGKGDEALKDYHDNGMVDISSKTQDEANKLAIKAYFEADNTERVNTKNEEARAKLKEDGKLQGSSMMVDSGKFGEKEIAVGDKVRYLDHVKLGKGGEVSKDDNTKIISEIKYGEVGEITNINKKDGTYSVKIGKEEHTIKADQQIEMNYGYKVPSVIVQSDTNATVNLINNGIRYELKKQGHLNGASTNVKNQDGEVRQMTEGDKVMWTGGGTTNFDNNGKIKTYNKFLPFQKQPAFGINNGEEFTISKIDNKKNTMSLKNGSGEERTISTNQDLPINHNYAITVNKSQGQSKDIGIYVPDSASVQDLSKDYVAMTRHKMEAKLILSDDFKGQMFNKVKDGQALPQDTLMAKNFAKEKGMEFKPEANYGDTKKFLATNEVHKHYGIDQHAMDYHKDFLVASTIQNEKKTTFDYKVISDLAEQRRMDIAGFCNPKNIPNQNKVSAREQDVKALEARKDRKLQDNQRSKILTPKEQDALALEARNQKKAEANQRPDLKATDTKKTETKDQKQDDKTKQNQPKVGVKVQGQATTEPKTKDQVTTEGKESENKISKQDEQSKKVPPDQLKGEMKNINNLQAKSMNDLKPRTMNDNTIHQDKSQAQRAEINKLNSRLKQGQQENQGLVQ